MELNMDIVNAIGRKKIEQITNKIYDRLNNQIIDYLNNIQFSKEDEENRLKQINEKNFLEINEKKINMCKLANKDPNISKPVENEKLIEAYNSARSQFNNVYGGMVGNDYQAYELQEKMQYYAGQIREYNNKLNSYEKAMNDCKINLEVFTVTDLNVKEIDYNKIYESIREEVVNSDV